MIYRFRFVSDEVVNFVREIEIDADATFLDLRNAILDSVKFSRDELDSFLICDDGWEAHEEITLEDMGSASDKDVWLMADTPISELVEDEGQKLRFVFDYMTDRSFFMELAEVETGRDIDAPVCTVAKGLPPKQVVALDDFEAQLEAANAKARAEADDLGFDDEGYDDEDLSSLSDDIEF